MKHRIQHLFYKAVWNLIWLFYPRMQTKGLENLPSDASIVVGNHSHAHGPIFSELYFPGKRYIWCAGQMMETSQIPDYAYQDFWCDRPRWTRPFYRILSYIIAPFASVVMRNADTIPVYRDSRILTTFKQTVSRLKEGNHIIIFPECRVGYNQILCQFQENYVDVAKLYYRRTGKRLQFVPMYLAPRLRSAWLGTPISFDPDNDIALERSRINAYLMEEITRMAESLPEHTVVPYPNIPRKYYPKNHSHEAIIHENTGG